MKDRGFIKALIERAIAAKCSALVLTVDLQVIGQRHQDIKNGMTVPPEWSLSKLIDFATKPAWVVRRAARQAPHLRQSRRPSEGHRRHHRARRPGSDSQFDTSLNWKDIEWIRCIWPGKLILKGILDVEDAEEAAKTGAQAMVVSNHGGRQLDGAPSSIEVLPEIVDAVGSRDRGHVRRRHPLGPGRDARAGARRQILHDRPRLCSTASAPAAKPASPRRSRSSRKELNVTMGLCGVNTIAEIDDHVLAI